MTLVMGKKKGKKQKMKEDKFVLPRKLVKLAQDWKVCFPLGKALTLLPQHLVMKLHLEGSLAGPERSLRLT